MAFINEKLTAEQQDDFKKRKFQQYNKAFSTPIYRTVDYEKGICLYNLGIVEKDSCDDQYLLFEYNGDEHIVVLRKTIIPPNTVKWEKSAYEKKFTGVEPFTEIFKEALSAMKSRGKPEEMYSNKNVLIQF
jgi:hypothetical protein